MKWNCSSCAPLLSVIANMSIVQILCRLFRCYCSDKGETLHIHNLHVHFGLHSHRKWLTMYLNHGLCILSCAAFVKYQIRDTIASFPTGTTYARADILYQIWKTLNFYKLLYSPLKFQGNEAGCYIYADHKVSGYITSQYNLSNETCHLKL